MANDHVEHIRIDKDQDGEVVYVSPTDEEYDAVAEIYNAM